jgi:hypothetical protein
MFERGVEGASIVSQTIINRKGASPKNCRLKEYKNTHKKKSRFKEICSPQKANVTWHIIKAYTLTLRGSIVGPRTAVRGPIAQTPQRLQPERTNMTEQCKCGCGRQCSHEV